MDTSKKVLIIQSYNPNKGDNSVLGIMISSLKQYSYELAITAFDPVKAHKDYQIPAFDYLVSFRKMKLASNKSVFLLEALKEGIWILYSLIYIILLKCGIHCPLPRHKRDIISAYTEADLVVLPGGHFFTSFNSLINNFSHFWGLKYAQWLHKKTMVYSQTVGPYKSNLVGRVERKMANWALAKANLVTLREEDSLRNYTGANVKVTAETVFIEPIHRIDMDIRKYMPDYKEEPIIGCTIHHIYYKHYFSKEKYIELMVGIFNAILAAYPCRILMIPMEDRYNTGGDRPMIREMMLRVDREFRHRINMVSEDLSSTETANVIANCQGFVGTKTHSIVYGLKTATPTLSISYQEKSTEFMKMFGMEHYAMPMKELNLKDFMHIFHQLFEKRESIGDELRKKYPLIRERAEYNNVLLNQLLYD